MSIPGPADSWLREKGGGVLDAGLLWLPAVLDEQCSEVYFFLGTRALKVAVFRLEAGFGLLLALGVLLLLQLLPLLSQWLLPPPLLAADLPSPSEESRALDASACGDSECELEDNEEEGVRFCGDLLLSLFSSESLFSPPSKESPAPRRFPPLARVEGGERFFIGFIFSSSSFFSKQLFYLFIPEILLDVPLLRCRVISSSFPFTLFSFSARPSHSHPVSCSLRDFGTCPPYSRDSELMYSTPACFSDEFAG